MVFFFLPLLKTYSYSKTLFIQSLYNQDSILNLDYNKIESLYKKDFANKEVAQYLAKCYLSKAQIDNAKYKIAKGYYLISKISNNTDRLKYLDSLIEMTKGDIHYIYPGLGYLNKGRVYFRLGENSNALKNYLIALDYAEKRNNTSQIFAINHNIGLLKNSSGDIDGSIKLFKNNLKFIKKTDTFKNKYSYLVNTLFALSNSYHNAELPDSARTYVNYGLRESIKIDDQETYSTFLILSGINSYMSKNYNKALDTLFKIKKRLQDSLLYDEADAIYTNLQIAKIYFKLNKKEKAYNYLSTLDTLIDETNYSKERRPALELLIEYYKYKNDVENQLKTVTKLLHLDSITNIKNENLKSDLVKKYDTAKLLKERDTIIKSLRIEKSASKFIILTISIILIILTFFVYNYYKKKKLYERRFNLLIEENSIKNQKEENHNKIVNKEEIDLHEDVISDLLEKLETFENKNLFLDRSIKLNSLAERFSTNSAYLSKIINHYKNKNFANYINDLRVDYCITRLKSDKKFRLYAIKYIAEESGFSSVQSFSRAFQKKTGINPSYFIKNIQNQKVE